MKSRLTIKGPERDSAYFSEGGWWVFKTANFDVCSIQFPTQSKSLADARKHLEIVE